MINENAEYEKIDDGNLVVESKIFEPQERFELAIKDLQGVDIESAISQKIATIRLKSSEAQDISLIVDPSGELKEMLSQLYLDTIYSIEIVIKYKNKGKPHDIFMKMVNALSKADETRRDIRAKLK